MEELVAAGGKLVGERFIDRFGENLVNDSELLEFQNYKFQSNMKWRIVLVIVELVCPESLVWVGFVYHARMRKTYAHYFL